MKNISVWLVLLLASTRAIFAASLPADWKNVQTIEIPKSGILKFSVPPATLNAARLGLEDLRLFDDRGRELPFLIERALPGRTLITPARSFRIVSLPEKSIVTFDTRLDRPIKAVNLMTPVDKFFKVVTVEGSTNGTSWQTLVKGEPIFRELSGARRLLLEFPPAVYESVRITIDEPLGGLRLRLSGAEIHAASTEPPIATEPLDLAIIEREERGTKTRIKLKSPLASFTLAELTVQANDPSFSCVLQVTVPGKQGAQINETEIWRDTIYRVPVANHPTAVKPSIKPDAPVIGRELILTIENGDQSPLHITGITAKRRPVYLVFFASEAGKVHLLSGNPHAAVPSYDLTGVRASVVPELLGSVTVSPLASNPAHRPIEVGPTTGAGFEVSQWKYRKRLEFTGGTLHEAELDLDVLSHATRSLQDVRVVRDGKPVPCVLQRSSDLASLTPNVSQANDPKQPKLSRWIIQLPRAALPLTQLECVTHANVFKRFMQLSEQQTTGRAGPVNVPLGSSEWIRISDQDSGRLSMTITRSPQTDRLTLETDNGNNPAINLENIQVWYPRAHLLFKAAPGGETFLYYGNPGAVAPPSDASLSAQRVPAPEKSKATLGREEVLRTRP